MKAVLFRSLFVLLLGVSFLIITEAGIYVLSRMGRIELASRSDIVAASRNMPGDLKGLKPIYTPHPYFGYVYTPNNSFAEGNYVANSQDRMRANSEGFIENELPHAKKKGECIYGLLGGSAAMSWGCARKELRLSYKLEKLLNTHLVTGKCKQYRVLNMGIGSHIQYQVTQIFLYYAPLLDGVIFYNGFNECAHGAMLTNKEPVTFPVINLYASLSAALPLSLKTFEMKTKLGRMANFLLKHRWISWSPLVRAVFKYRLRKVERSQATVQARGHGSALPGLEGAVKKNLRRLFPEITAEKLMHSYDRDDPVVREVLQKILPLVYTEPTLEAYAVARKRGIPFLSVIQPMIFLTGKGSDWKERRIATYHFQKCCMDTLLEEAKRLERFGIKTHDVNEKNLLGRDSFWSQVHIKPEGNEIVARYLFGVIKKEWHSNDGGKQRNAGVVQTLGGR